jgi:hypothetical protein
VEMDRRRVARVKIQRLKTPAQQGSSTPAAESKPAADTKPAAEKVLKPK